MNSNTRTVTHEQDKQQSHLATWIKTHLEARITDLNFLTLVHYRIFYITLQSLLYDIIEGRMLGKAVIYSFCSIHHGLFSLAPSSIRIDFKVAALTYNTLCSGHPANLRELISPYQPSHSMQYSNQLVLTVPHANHSIGQRTFCHSSPSIRNSIALSVKEALSISK